MFNKITVGFVIQTYNEKGKCTAQEFVAGDDVTWEDELGEQIDSPFDIVLSRWDDLGNGNIKFFPTGDNFTASEEYFPFNMKQPRKV